MTNDEIDAAIRAAIVGALPEYGSADLVSTTETDFAIYRAGYAAGLEAAAKECRPSLRSMVSRSEIAVAILALKVEGEHE